MANSISHTYSVDEVRTDLWAGYRFITQQYLTHNGLTALPPFELNEEGTKIKAWFPTSWTVPSDQVVNGVEMKAGSVAKIYEQRDIGINSQEVSLALEKNAQFSDPDAPAEPSRHDLIVAAARGLDRADASLFTGTGVPTVEALKAATGLTDITSEERDAAWAEVSA